MASPVGEEVKSSALLLLDYQAGYFERVPGAEILFAPGFDDLPAHVASVRRQAKAAGVQIVYIDTGFRPGHPEIAGSPSAGHQMVRANGLFVLGSPEQEFQPDLRPDPDDVTIVKHRWGGFSGTDLDQILRANGIRTIVLAGIATSGSVLTTLRTGVDLDYRVVVLADCCRDADEEKQRVLLEKIFPSQATVTTSEAWLASLSAG